MPPLLTRSLAPRAVAAAPVALAFALAFAQSPGRATSDTKIDLHVDPGGFLADVAASWSPTGDLGHVQGGQYGGYLLPMAPFFALGRAVGIGPWVVHRLWLAIVLAVAAYGVVRLLDALSGRPRGVLHLAAAVLFLVNPYVAVFVARTSITLLAYAALPWLLLCVHRGLRSPRSWWWPAAFALGVSLTGGGVNAAVTAWALLGPVLLVAYEWWTRAADLAAVRAFAWRTALATAVTSAWWVVPVLVHARYGLDFLPFTEQQGTIWGTTSAPESLRLMGYWVSYLGVGYGGTLTPYFAGGSVLLFSTPVVIAGLLVPGLAMLGLRWTARAPYAPFFLLLALFGLLVMIAGFPEGTPLRRALNFAYEVLAPVQFLRTTYKAAPLLALAVAVLGGHAVAALTRRRGVAVVALGALPILAAWPLVRGEALDDRLLWDEVPAHWRAAAAHVDRAVGDDGRAVVLPGQLYAYYRWGATIDPILPALAERPVAVRSAVPYGDLRGVDLLWTVDALVQQHRAVPRQLGRLLDLLGARVVVSGADDERARSGGAPAAEAASVLDDLGAPDATWGRVRPEPRAAGTLGAARPLPRTRAWDRPSAKPLVRVEADAPATVVDGSGAGLAALAAFGPLPAGRTVYAADVDAAALRRAAEGGEVVVTDTNRRQVFVASRMVQERGAVLAAGDPLPEDAAVLDPFRAGTDAQTVAVLEGAASVRAPFSPQFPQFPERRPFAAVDGDPETAWIADRALEQERRYVEVAFDAPRDVPYVDVLPYSDARGRVTSVEVAGRAFAVRPAWNRLRIGARGVTSLRIGIAGVAQPEGVPGGAGGLREVRVPGLRVREALRGPVLAERALAGRDLSATALSYVWTRQTGADPFRRDVRGGTLSATLVRDRLDAETGLERVFAPPAARRWAADAWVTVPAGASDSALDRLAGARGGARAESSARFQGRPGFRASSAFDGTSRPWIGFWLPDRGAWLAWTAREPVTVRELRLVAPRERVRAPTEVRLHVDGRAGPRVRVAADGRVRLPARVRGRAFRLEIVRAAFAPGTPGRIRQRRAVGIAEVRGAGVRMGVPRRGAFRARCGALRGTVGGREIALAVAGRLGDLDAGRPLRARGCGSIALPAGRVRLELPAATFAPYLLRLGSAAPRPVARAAAAPGVVADPGRAGRNARTDVRLELRQPAWLVLGQSHNPGWRATCDGDDLGAPEPVDGYAMGWRVPATCREADLAFAPDRVVRAGYAVSAPALLAVLALLLLRRPPQLAGVSGSRRAARPAARQAVVGVAAQGRSPADDRAPGSARPMAARRAAAWALAAGAVLGFCIAARSAPLIALGTYVVLRRGVSVRALVTAAGVILVVAVPVLTLAIPVENRGGFNSEYAQARIAVHWVTQTALVLLWLALARLLAASRARRAEATRPPARRSPARRRRTARAP